MNAQRNFETHVRWVGPVTIELSNQFGSKSFDIPFSATPTPENTHMDLQNNLVRIYHVVPKAIRQEAQAWKQLSNLYVYVQAAHREIINAYEAALLSLAEQLDPPSRELESQDGSVVLKTTWPVIWQESVLGQYIISNAKTPEGAFAAAQIIGLDIPEEAIIDPEHLERYGRPRLPDNIQRLVVPSQEDSALRYAMQSAAQAENTKRELTEARKTIAQAAQYQQRHLLSEDVRVFWNKRARKVRFAAETYTYAFYFLLLTGVGGVLIMVAGFEASLLRSMVSLFHPEQAVKLFGDDFLTGRSFDAISYLLPILFFLIWAMKTVAKKRDELDRLATDAEHRLAMLETYWNMAADDVLELGEQEHHIMVESLFRQIPYVEGADTSQPASANIINKLNSD